jgi:Arc/MetJ-type ribon-helix-helix transcriptional regulator
MLKTRMKRGGYRSPEDAVRAGLAYLEQQEQAADFGPGELDRLLAVADAEIDRGEMLDGQVALRARRRRRVRRSKSGE